MSSACEKAWAHFLEQHPFCGHEGADSVPAGTAGLEGYTVAPFNAWSGWRYRIPGGPIGGQYHGFIAPDDSIDGIGWPAGHDETFRAVDNPAGLGGMPWHGWDDTWGGIPLNEGETVSDYVYRGPAEMRPRPNASGGAHTVRAVQTRRSSGYATAPGNYRGLGVLAPPPLAAPHSMMRVSPIQDSIRWGGGPIFACPPGADCEPIRGGPRAGPSGPTGGPIFAAPPIPICSQMALAPCPPGQTRGNSGPPCYTESGPCMGPTVAQPPPPYYPQPGPVVGSDGCISGQYRDAAGNCTADWSHPSPLYLPPDQSSPQPSPTISANTCPTGYTQDPNTGNCLAPGVAPSGSGIMAWLGASTTIGGVNIPNAAIAGVGALIAMKMFGGRR
jgi:hypothetical protein